MKHLLTLGSPALVLTLCLLLTSHPLSAETAVPAPAKKAATQKTTTPPTGKEDGWVQLTGKDFQKVNCKEDTWRWEEGHAFCTGQPVGVISSHEPLVDFELLCEWKHKQHARWQLRCFCLGNQGEPR